MKMVDTAEKRLVGGPKRDNSKAVFLGKFESQDCSAQVLAALEVAPLDDVRRWGSALAPCDAPWLRLVRSDIARHVVRS